MTPYMFAKLVLRAQDIGEASWEAVEKGRYGKTEAQAAEEAVLELEHENEWAMVVYLLNRMAWNDIQDWATAVIKAEDGP